MRKNLDENFTYELELNLGIFKLKISLNIAGYSQSRCFPKNIDISSRVFSINISEKKSSNVLSYVGIIQYLSYKLFL